MINPASTLAKLNVPKEPEDEMKTFISAAGI
jgi:hypothetical protein